MGVKLRSLQEGARMTKKCSKKVIEFGPRPLDPQTKAQSRYLLSMQSNPITYGIGSAGTGKTYLAASYAADLLHSRNIRQIVLTRPPVEAGTKLGHLPGTLDEKYAPYLAPVEDVFVQRYGRGWYESQINNSNILAVPLGYMQGRSFDDCFILADEMQNSTPDEMFMLLTRIGKYTKLVINGDPRMQKMIRGVDGITDSLSKLQHLREIGEVVFTPDDIVRSDIVGKIVRAYDPEG
jgi:phosphate starvation-inducible PhoH-like protein